MGSSYRRLTDRTGMIDLIDAIEGTDSLQIQTLRIEVGETVTKELKLGKTVNGSLARPWPIGGGTPIHVQLRHPTGWLRPWRSSSARPSSRQPRGTGMTQPPLEAPAVQLDLWPRLCSPQAHHALYLSPALLVSRSAQSRLLSVFLLLSSSNEGQTTVESSCLT